MWIIPSVSDRALRFLMTSALLMCSTAFLVAQSPNTVTFSGSSANFNAAEKISAAAGNTDYYITYDASNLYVGAFRTSGTFATTDNFTIYLDTDPQSVPTSGSGTTAGQSYNGVTGTLPFTANYSVHAEESYQEARIDTASWSTTITGLTYHTGSTWREVAIPFSAIGNPDALYLSMWMGQASAIYSNAPGADLGGSANPTVVDYIGGIGLSSASCIPVNTTNSPITASITDATPAAGITYGKVSVTSATITATNDFNVAAGGSILVSGGSLDLSNRTIQMGGSTGTGHGASINYTAGTLSTNAATSIAFLGEGHMVGSGFTYSGAMVLNRAFYPLAAGATVFGNGARLDLRSGSSVVTNAPTYNTGSTLAYNTGTTSTAGIEWTSNAASGVGVPCHVVIGDQVANSVISFGSVSAYRRATGSLTISNVTAGNGLTLSTNLGGDLQLGGDFIQNGTFTPNGRSVTMNGSAAQAISGSFNTAGSTDNFPVLIVNNSHASGVTLNSNARITATAGDVLSIQGVGPLNIGASTTLTIEGNGGNIRTSGGARVINFNAATSAMDITGTKTFAASVGGTLSLNSSVASGVVNLAAAVNFGSSVTTIGNNTYLQINSGGSVSTNAPTYATGSTLVYNQGGTLSAGTEWTANSTSAVGVPHHVLIGNGVNTTLNFGASAQYRHAKGGVTIATSSALTLSSAAGGNLQLAGNFTNSGTFTHNSRDVSFIGASAQQLSGSTTFHNLILNNANGLTLNNAVTVANVVTLTSGNIVLGSNNLTLSNTATGAITGAFGSSRMVVTNGSGQLIRAIATGGLPITYNFPVGDNTGTTEYSPASFVFSANGVARNIGVRAIDANHPQLNTSPTQTDYTSRYWSVTNSAGSTYTYTPSFTYPAADLNGSESNLRMNMYNGSAWTHLVASSSASNVLGSGGSLTNATLPLGATAEFTGRVNNGTTYTWNQTGTANFTTAGNWTPSRSTTSVNDILVFNNGATTTATNVPAQTIGKLLISGNTNVSFTSTTDVTLTISGGNDDDFSVASGSTAQLSSSGGNAITFAFSNACTGLIAGNLTINGNTGFDNRYNATNSVTTVSGTINNRGIVTGSASALNFTSTGQYIHNHTSNAGNIPVATWDNASTCTIQGYTSTNYPGNLNQAFGNFTWNCAGQSGNVTMNGTLTTINGNFVISNTNGNDLRLSSNTSYVLNVGGNLTLSGSNSELRLIDSNGAYSAEINVDGNYTQSGTGSTLNLNNGDDLSSGTLRVAGNFSFTTGTITQTSGDINDDNLIEFNGTVAQTINLGGTISNEINYRVNNPAGVNLTGTITIQSDCTFYRTAGSITGGTISYNGSNSYLVYDNTAPLTTSSVEWPTSNDPENVTINSTSTVTLHASRTVENDGVFTSQSGVFILGSNDLTLSNTSAASLVNSSPSATNMIAASGSGQLKRTLPNSARDLYFYIGDVTGTNEYSGMRLNFSTNSLNGRVVGVRVVDDTSATLSTPYAPIDYLSRHWIVTLSSNSGSYDYDPSLAYSVAGDVNGTENNLQVAAFPSGASAWNHYATSIASPTLTKTGTDLSEANFNLNNAVFSGRAPVKYWDGSQSTVWADANNWTPSGIPTAADNIDFNGNAINPCVLTSSVTVNHLTMSDGGDLSLSSGASLTVAGNFTHNITASIVFDCNSTFNLTNTVFNQTVPALTYGNLNLGTGARTLAASDTIRICGNYTPTSGALTTTGSTVEFMGVAAQTIQTNNTNFFNLIVSNTAGNVNSGNNVTVGGNMQVDQVARFNKTAGSLVISSGATANIDGFLRNAGTITTTGALTVDSTGVYEHNTTTPGTIPTATWVSGSTCELIGNFSNGNIACGSQNFHHFKVNYSGNGDVNTNESLTTVNGDLTIQSTGTGSFSLANSGSVTVNVAGDVIHSDGDWIISTSNNTDVIINVAGDFSQTGGYIDMVEGNGSATAEIRITGNYARTGNGEITTTGLVTPNGIFSFVGTNQTITETSSGSNRWVDYTIANGSTTQLLSDLNIWGSAFYISYMNVQSGGILDLNTYFVGGTGYNTSTISSGSKVITANTSGLMASASSGGIQTATRVYNSGATYEFDGTSNQNTGDFWTATSTPNSVANLIINNTATTVTMNSGTNVTVSGTLTFAAANTAALDVGAQTIYTSNTATSAVTRSGLGHVIGILRRAYTTGTNTYDFHVGTSTAYAPASFAMTASAAGSFTVKSTDGAHPNMATDGLSQTSYVNRYWTVAYVFGNITSNASTFTYVPADLIGGATAATLRLKRYSAAWTAPAYTSVVNQLTATGLNNTTTYGDFFAAADCSSFTASITPSGSTTICNGDSLDLTASSTISGSTYAWSPATGLSSTTGATVTASPSSTQTYTVTATSPQNCVDTEVITVTVNSIPVPAVVIALTTGTNPTCNGSSMTFTATPTNGGASPSYQWKVNGSNVGTDSDTYTTSSLTNGQTVSCVLTSNAACASPTTATSNSIAVTVNARPTGVLGGNQTVCVGSTATLYINTTGSGNYSGTLNPGGIPFSGSGAFLTVDVTPASTTTYSIATLSDDNCSSVGGDLSGAPTVTVRTLPTVAIGGTTSVCEGSSTNITFTGTPDSEVTYTINGGSNQTVMLDGSGNATVSTGAVLGNMTYALVSIDDYYCPQSASGSAVITKLALPDATITGNNTICSGTATTVTFNGTPLAVVTYSINGGAGITQALNGSGSAVVNTGVLVANTTYTLVSVTNGSCSQSIGTSILITTVSNTYYQDFDGDGFGNAAVTSTGCTPPVGYVADNTDCCDTNADINPLTEWWADVDGDGFASFIMDIGCLSGVTCNSATWPAQHIPYYPAAHGGAPYVTDCNDTSVLIYPGSIELCGNNIDDDCDGTADEGCFGLPNDVWANATLLNTSVTSAIYPNCLNYNGTVMNAGISSQGNPANVQVGGGRDVWYKFVAPSNAIQVKVTPSGFDAVIELQNSSAIQIDAENVNTSIGGLEILNYASLVPGQTYYIGVRNYHATNVGTFAICASPMMASGCALTQPVGGFNLCSSYKAVYRGANSYTFNFTGVGGNAALPLATTSASSSGLLPLSTPSLDLRHGGIYNVRVDANFQVYNGLNVAEPMITVLGSIAGANCSNVLISAQPTIEVRANQTCPAVLNRNIYLQGVPSPGQTLPCGVVSYTFEFTKVSDCTGLTIMGAPFTVTTASSSPYLILAAAFPAAQANIGFWNVIVRPNFSWGPGTYGPSETIQITGTSASTMLQESPLEGVEKTDANAIGAIVYPNPNTGSTVNISMPVVESKTVDVRIFDGYGKLVYGKTFAVEGSLFTTLDFDQTLSAGIYMIELKTGKDVITERMIVSK